MRRVWWAIASLIAATGCVDSIEPDVGPPLRATCNNLDSDPGTAVSFQHDLVDGIFRSTTFDCVHCHTPTGDSPLGLLVGGLDLSSYDSLRRGGAQSGADVVVPGRPCDSALYRKVESGPPFGGRMPLDGPPYLTALDSDLIADWIAEGAHAN
jgi:Planctomycete cytochrome C